MLERSTPHVWLTATHVVSITREGGGRKKKILWRHSSVPLNVMFKPKSLSACVWFVCVCVSVTDKEITASSLAERSALASRTDCRYEAVSAGPSPLSLAGSGSPGGRLRPSGPAPSQRETLLHCRCGDRLELLREWRTQVGTSLFWSCNVTTFG